MKQKIGVLCAMRDDRAARWLQREMDDGETCTFRIVKSGTDALLAARQFAPDILVIEAVLPGVDGLGVVDRMKEMFGGRMPRVIAGTMMPFSDEGFAKRGVQRFVKTPWSPLQLRREIEAAMEEIDTLIDWNAAQDGYERACALLEQMGMRSSLHGFRYLAWAAALAACNEARVHAIGTRIYAPIAERFDTTAQNVERLIRHAVESTMDSSKAKGIYGFFGNTIDPTRGKPTNAQALAALVERLRVTKKRHEHVRAHGGESA